MGSKAKNNRNKNPKNATEICEAVEADGGGNHVGNKIITDTRFSSVHSDPRFREAPKHKSKVTIDSRFDRMFTDKSFGSSTARIDKRGKIKKTESTHNPLKHYYRLEEQEKEDVKVRNKAAVVESEEERENEKSDSETSDSEDDDVESEDSLTSSSTDSEEDDDVVYSEGEDNFVQEENVPEIEKETRRLAVVNLDWGQVKAEDLYVLISSFLPKGGQIMSVSVYPSEFGLKRMEEEAVHGPVGLFDDDKDKNNDTEDDDDEIDNEKLRSYELSRLRYYYAVVECDSIATADYLYKTCDGVEFERSSNKLDLRFIPDSMEFKHPPRDVATEAPGNYEGLDFHTRALQQSKIDITWDEDEPQRVKTLKRKFNADQLAELELKEFLASDDSETDEDVNEDAIGDRSAKKHKKQDLYRALIQSGDGSDGDEEEGDQDMEVTFNTGLENISKRILEKKDKKSETVWETHLRKRREKKMARKNKSKNSSEDETSDTDPEPTEEADDFFVEEQPSVKGTKEARGKSDRKGKESQETAAEAEARTAELELLLADDKGADTSLKGYNLKPKKEKWKKGKKMKEILDEGKIPTIDYDDPRFSAFFTSPHFALDPTDPQFKRSAAYARQIAQKQQKGDDRKSIEGKEHTDSVRQAQSSDNLETGGEKQLGSNGFPSNKEKQELSSLVRYYYAVVECDSIATADYLYKTCDGVEFERSSNKLDLRFIPDSMEFKHPPRDVATEAPGNYEGLDFHTRALQQSKIDITWDEDEPQHVKTLKRKFNVDQLAELELKEFLASDDSETDEDVNEDAIGDRSAKKHKKQDLYRALIQSGDGSDGDEEEGGQDMEVTFHTGLENISKRILEKKDKKSETVWETHLRKRREKKMASKNKSKNSSEDETSDTDPEPTEEADDFFVEEQPSVKGTKEARGKSGRKGKESQETAAEAEAHTAELELLLADDKGADTSLKGYNLKPKKEKWKKGKKMKEILDEGKIPTIDYDDPRFSAFFTSPHFALDPTDPQFKRSAAYARQIAQKQQKGDDRKSIGGKEHTDSVRQAQSSDNLETGGEKQLGSNGFPSNKEKQELSSLVRSIRLKSKQSPLFSNGKVSNRK